MKLARIGAVLMLVAGLSSALYGSVPELDQGSAVNAAMLVGGVILVIRSRKR